MTGMRSPARPWIPIPSHCNILPQLFAQKAVIPLPQVWTPLDFRQIPRWSQQERPFQKPCVRRSSRIFAINSRRLVLSGGLSGSIHPILWPQLPKDASFGIHCCSYCGGVEMLLKNLDSLAFLCSPDKMQALKKQSASHLRFTSTSSRYIAIARTFERAVIESSPPRKLFKHDVKFQENLNESCSLKPPLQTLSAATNAHNRH